MREKERTQAELELFIMGKIARDLRKLRNDGRERMASWLASIAKAPYALGPEPGRSEPEPESGELFQ
jgi:hypothetical protein